jgi:prophage regulatory protein
MRQILRIPAVKSLIGLSRSTLYARIAAGEFIKPVSLGARAVGFPSSEVEAINDARVAGKSTEEIRELVAKLHAARKSGGAQ